jgi:hypothetical protein
MSVCVWKRVLVLYSKIHNILNHIHEYCNTRKFNHEEQKRQVLYITFNIVWTVASVSRVVIVSDKHRLSLRSPLNGLSRMRRKSGGDKE